MALLNNPAAALAFVQSSADRLGKQGQPDGNRHSAASKAVSMMKLRNGGGRVGPVPDRRSDQHERQASGGLIQQQGLYPGVVVGSASCESMCQSILDSYVELGQAFVDFMNCDPMDYYCHVLASGRMDSAYANIGAAENAYCTSGCYGTACGFCAGGGGGLYV